jgi:hypothetical protein
MGSITFLIPSFCPTVTIAARTFRFASAGERAAEELWAIVDADIKHVGEMRYGQPYIRKLRQGVR